MARRRDWTNPWSNPLGEILATVHIAAVRALGRSLNKDDRDASFYDEEPQPEPAWTGLRFCKECGTGTLHREYFWRIEDETTIECDKCGAVYVTG